MPTKKFLRFVKNMYCRYIYDDLPSTGAQIAFYLFLSILPFLIFIIGLLTYTPAANFEFYMGDLSKIMPRVAYDIVRYMVNQAVAHRRITMLLK